MKLKDLLILHYQYHGDARSQGIRSPDIVVDCPDYSGLFLFQRQKGEYNYNERIKKNK